MKINLTLPIPPSVNSYWVNARGGSHKFLSEKARQFRSDVLHILLKENLIDLKITQRLKYTCYLYFPDKRKRDIDNYHKGVLDALTNGKVYLDDSQIDEMYVFRKEIIKNGKIEIIIETLGD